MGMDVYGHEPIGEAGEYFRANVWSWRPLAAFLITHHPDLAHDGWQYNDGHGLNDEGATELARRLREQLADGTVAREVEEFNAFKAEESPTPCPHCHGEGIRRDEVGISMGMHEARLDPAIAILVGREFGTCNGCGGEGKQLPWSAHYGFDQQIVEEFALFCEQSGGFEIR